ncbi:MAG: glycosyltransferase family 2 protein [Chitinophagaceae bacterium]
MATAGKKDIIHVVILTYNRLALLKKCLDAVFNQTVKPDQILIVNNGSTDGTLQWLESLEQIKIITQENSGSSGGFHTGIKSAYEQGADWIWVMDDDVYPENNCLEKLIKYSTLSECLHPIHFDNFGEMREEEIYLDPSSCNIISSFNSSYKQGKKIWYRNAASFEGMLISKNIIEKIGFPDPRFFIMHDDLIYGYQASKFTNVAVAAEAIMHKQVENKTQQTSFRNLYYIHRNLWLVEEYLAKDLPGFDGYRKRRIRMKFLYTAYQVMKENEFKDKWKALKILWKAYRDYKAKKQGQGF